jgi:outer membrane protein assembly factor BamB
MNDFRQRPMLGVMARTVALVAGLLVLVLALLLISDHVRLLQMDPLNDPVLLELREMLADAPESDEAVVEQIRTYDLYARRAFFSNQAQRRSGGLLLLGGAIVCFVALKLSVLWSPRLPAVGKPDIPDHWTMNALFRQLMAGTGVFLVVISLFLAFVVQSDLAIVMSQSVPPAVADPVPEGAAALQTVISPEAFAANWPNLRGPGGYGVAPSTEAPIHWDVRSGKGVLWSVPMDVPGFNSPVVWGKRVFMTGANDDGQQVFCFDRPTWTYPRSPRMWGLPPPQWRLMVSACSPSLRRVNWRHSISRGHRSGRRTSACPTIHTVWAPRSLVMVNVCLSSTTTTTART